MLIIQGLPYARDRLWQQCANYAPTGSSFLGREGTTLVKTKGLRKSFGLRGGESGLGGTCIGFGNGFAGGKPRGGSGFINHLD